MSVPSPRLAVAGLLALSALAAGCGGSSKPAASSGAAPASPSASPQISAPQVQGKLDRPHYIAVADGVCSKARAIATAGNKAVGQALQAGQPAAAAAAVQHFYPQYVESIVQLEAIRPPHADIPQLKKIFKVMEEETRTLPIYARALTSGDKTVLKAVGVVEQRLSAQVGSAAKAYGFKVCGQS